MKIDTVVFDLGGVLVDWNPRYLYRKLMKDELQIEKFLTEVCNGDWNLQQDAGRSFSDGIRELVAIFPEQESHIRAYFARWIEMMGGPIVGTVAILEELHHKRQCRLFALSNWSAETFPQARPHFSFFDLFESILVSGEEKLIKPDPRFYQLLSDRHGVDPKHAVFIDDVEKNVAAARVLGFHAIQFSDAASLRQRLADLGAL